MRKTIAIILAILMLSSLFVGCKNSGGDSSGNYADSGSEKTEGTGEEDSSEESGTGEGTGEEDSSEESGTGGTDESDSGESGSSGDTGSAGGSGNSGGSGNPNGSGNPSGSGNSGESDGPDDTDKDEPDESGSGEGTGTEEPDESGSTDDPDDTDGPDESDSTDGSDGPVEPNVPAFERGQVTGSSYVNGMMGLKFTLPSGWRFCSNDEISTIMELTIGGGDLLSDLSYYVEFGAMNTRYGSVIAMTVEDVNSLGLSEENSVAEYIEILKQRGEGKTSGARFTFGGESDKTLGNTAFRKIDVNYRYSGFRGVQGVYVARVGNAMITLTVVPGILGNYDVEDFETAFTQP